MSLSQPSHTLGYWRPWKKDSNLIDSWLDYNRDVSLQRYNAEIVSEALEKVTREQVNAINNLSSRLTTGFEIISDKLNVTNNKLDKLIQLELSSQLILCDIAYYLRIPDSEKSRLFHIKNAINFLNNVEKEQSFYSDALSEFRKAEHLNSSDFYTLYNIAMIYLYDTNNVDINASKEYFLKAAKYSLLIEKNSKIYTEIISKATIENIESLKQSLTGYCYLQASICSYILGDDQEALELAIKAKSNGISSADFYIGKYASRLQLIDVSLSSLDSCLKQDATTYKKIITDYDYILNEKIIDFLQKYNEDIEMRFEKVKPIIVEYILKGDKVPNDIISKSILVSKYNDVDFSDLSNLRSRYKQLRNEIPVLKAEFENTRIEYQKLQEKKYNQTLTVIHYQYKHYSGFINESVDKWLTLIAFTIVLGIAILILVWIITVITDSQIKADPNFVVISIALLSFGISLYYIESSELFHIGRNLKKAKREEELIKFECEKTSARFDGLKKDLAQKEIEFEILKNRITSLKIKID